MNSKNGCLATGLLLVIGTLVAYSALLNYASAKRAELFEQALNASTGASEQMLAMARARLTPDAAPTSDAIQRDLEALRNGAPLTTEAEPESTTPLYDLLLARPEDPPPTWICKDRSSWGHEAEAWADEFQAAATPYIASFLEASAALPTGGDAILLAELLRTNMELYIASKDYARADEILLPYTRLFFRLQRECPPGSTVRMDIDGANISFPIFARFIIVFNLDHPAKVDAIVDVLNEFDTRTHVGAALADQHLRNLIHIKDWEEETLDSAIASDGLWWGTRNWLWPNACGPLFTHDVETYVRLAERTQEFKQSDYYVHGDEHAKLLREVEDLSELYPISGGVNVGLHMLLYNNVLDAQRRMLCVAAKVAVYRRHEGKFPTDLAALMGSKANEFVDPFTGDPFRLEPLDSPESFVLTSAGRDGKLNTLDDDDYPWLKDPCAGWSRPKPKFFIKTSTQ